MICPGSLHRSLILLETHCPGSLAETVLCFLLCLLCGRCPLPTAPPPSPPCRKLPPRNNSPGISTKWNNCSKSHQIGALGLQSPQKNVAKCLRATGAFMRSMEGLTLNLLPDFFLKAPFSATFSPCKLHKENVKKILSSLIGQKHSRLVWKNMCASLGGAFEAMLLTRWWSSAYVVGGLMLALSRR